MTLAAAPTSAAPAVTAYRRFLDSKRHSDGALCQDPSWMPDSLFDFQKDLLCFGTRKGRGAIFADCGLGKSAIQLVWGENVVRRENTPVLVLTPLAVAAQTIREGEKFGVECERSHDGRFSGGARVIVANYERLHHFDPNDFAGVVCDESSILKNFDGKRRGAVTEFMRRVQFRLLCTATAAPNDYVELGTSSEALGELGHMDMLSRFFVNDTNTLHIYGTKHGDFSSNRWRFKAHAEPHFWRWICSWARACRKPSDLGYDDGRFILPELITRETVVKASRPAPGMLFEVSAKNLAEQREECRRTLNERCEAVARLFGDTDEPSVAWCQLNDEGDLLERLIPGAVQVAGSDPDEAKEEAFAAFSAGEIRKLITKPKIGGFGLNWQHCARMTFFPSHSFEQFYQAVRRCWRFGQTRPVHVDVVTTEGGAGAMESLRRKAAAADRMFSELVALMSDPSRIGRTAYGETQEQIPAWL